jgi:hypothetical protein
MIQAIETRYGGHLFRSRTEARWAVFFNAAKITFEYEAEGFVVDGRRYLPDFWLPQAGMFFEVKGVEPSQSEINLCQRLADLRRCTVLLAIGPPAPDHPSIIGFFHGEGREFSEARFEIRDDMVRQDVSLYREGSWFRMFQRETEAVSCGRAYEAARSARFEFGESGPTNHKPNRAAPLSDFGAASWRQRNGILP